MQLENFSKEGDGGETKNLGQDLKRWLWDCLKRRVCIWLQNAECRIVSYDGKFVGSNLDFHRHLLYFTTVFI